MERLNHTRATKIRRNSTPDEIRRVEATVDEQDPSASENKASYWHGLMSAWSYRPQPPPPTGKPKSSHESKINKESALKNNRPLCFFSE